MDIPGAVVCLKSKIKLSEGRRRILLEVKNEGDRPIQVGSHYPFMETNPALVFDRVLAYGMHMDIPAGNATRFEPGERKTVALVEIGGNKVLSGGSISSTLLNAQGLFGPRCELTNESGSATLALATSVRRSTASPVSGSGLASAEAGQTISFHLPPSISDSAAKLLTLPSASLSSAWYLSLAALASAPLRTWSFCKRQ